MKSNCHCPLLSSFFQFSELWYVSCCLVNFGSCREEIKNATWNLLDLLSSECELNLGQRDQSLESSLSFGGHLHSDIGNLVSDFQICLINNAFRDKKVFEKGWKHVSMFWALLENLVHFLGVLCKYKGVHTLIHTQRGCDSKELCCNLHRTQPSRKSAVSGTGFPFSTCRVAIGIGEGHRSILSVEMGLENC